METKKQETVDSNRRWTSCPLRDERPVKSFLLISLIVMFSLVTSFFMGSNYGFLAPILLTITTAKYFFPTYYLITNSGIEIKFFLWSKRRNWHHYRRYLVHDDGIFLSPYLTSSRLDSFQGDFVRIKNRRKEDLFAFIKEKIDEQYFKS